MLQLVKMWTSPVGWITAGFFGKSSNNAPERNFSNHADLISTKEQREFFSNWNRRNYMNIFNDSHHVTIRIIDPNFKTPACTPMHSTGNSSSQIRGSSHMPEGRICFNMWIIGSRRPLRIIIRCFTRVRTSSFIPVEVNTIAMSTLIRISVSASIFCMPATRDVQKVLIRRLIPKAGQNVVMIRIRTFSPRIITMNHEISHGNEQGNHHNQDGSLDTHGEDSSAPLEMVPIAIAITSSIVPCWRVRSPPTTMYSTLDRRSNILTDLMLLSCG